MDTDKRIEGVVLMFSDIRGFGFLLGDDGRTYFVHNNNIVMDGFRSLVLNSSVNFLPVQEDGKGVAYCVEPQVSANVPRLNSGSRSIPALDSKENVSLEIDGDGRIFVLGKSGERIAPSVWVDGQLQAYGDIRTRMKGFNLDLPSTTAERAFVLLNNDLSHYKEKARHVDFGCRYEGVQPRGYVLRLDASGLLVIQRFGFRSQQYESTQGCANWAVIEQRLQLELDLSDPSEEWLQLQMPSSELGLKRSGVEFVHGIRVALRRMQCIAEATRGVAAR